LDWTAIHLYSPEDFSTPVWSSGELSPFGTPQSGGVVIADYTGDGALDMAAYAISTTGTDKAVFFNSEFFLFEGPSLVDISPYHKPGEYWTLGVLWDFDGDNAAEMLLQRFLSGSDIRPRFILTAPSREFEILFEHTDNDAESMGLVGIYQIPQ
jgi:hypothetical protein